MIDVVYFSNITQNTQHFINKLSLDEDTVHQIPIKGEFEGVITRPYVLITPTYNGRGVPIQVMKFLRIGANRKHMVGVIASGNRNFGADFAIAGSQISRKCGVPFMDRFEIRGTDEDVKRVKEGLKSL